MRSWPSRSTRLSGCGTPPDTTLSVDTAQRIVSDASSRKNRQLTTTDSIMLIGGFGCDADSIDRLKTATATRLGPGGRRPNLAAVAFYVVSSWTRFGGTSDALRAEGVGAGCHTGLVLNPGYTGTSTCGRSRISLRGRRLRASFRICRGLACTSWRPSSSGLVSPIRGFEPGTGPAAEGSGSANDDGDEAFVASENERLIVVGERDRSVTDAMIVSHADTSSVDIYASHSVGSRAFGHRRDRRAARGSDRASEAV